MSEGEAPEEWFHAPFSRIGVLPAVVALAALLWTLFYWMRCSRDGIAIRYVEIGIRRRVWIEDCLWVSGVKSVENE